MCVSNILNSNLCKKRSSEISNYYHITVSYTHLDVYKRQRYWCSEKSQVRTRFLNSVFLGHSTSQDLMKAFKEALNGISLHKIFQISMDGPAVNWKFLRELKDEFQCLPSAQCFVDMESCGLHVIHGAFKTRITASGWKVI